MRHLAIEIYGTNELNRIIKIEVENIIKQLPQYIGKKIFLSNGTTSKVFEVDHLKPEPQPNKRINVLNGSNHGVYYCRGNGGAFGIGFKINIGVKEKPTDQHCIANYFNRGWVEIGKCDGDKLIEVYDLNKIIQINKLDEVINEQEEINKIEQCLEIYNKAQTALRAIKGTLKVGYSDYLPRFI